jgi:hypothetical protein
MTDRVSSDQSSPVKRRTLVTAVAWSVPAIATSVAVPASAASPVSVALLSFSTVPGPAVVGRQFGDLVVHVTDGEGNPLASQVVTVSLASGLRFVGGATSKPIVTSATGDALVYDIEAVSAGSWTVTAAADRAVSITTTLSATALVGQAVAIKGKTIGSDRRFPNVPATAVAIGAQYFHDPVSKTLWWKNSKIAAENVTQAFAYQGEPYDQFASFISSGKAYEVREGDKPGLRAKIPEGSTAVGGNYFLDPDNNLWYGNTGIIQKGVTSVIGYAAGTNASYVSTLDATNTMRVFRYGSLAWNAVIPAGSTLIGELYYVTASKELRKLNFAGRVLAKDVVRALGFATNRAYAGYIRADGAACEVDDGATTSKVYATIPTYATPLGNQYYLTRDGDLWWSGQFVASNVNSAVSHFDPDGNQWVTAVIAQK